MQINSLNKSNILSYSSLRNKTNDCQNVSKTFEENIVSSQKSTYVKNSNSNSNCTTYNQSGFSVKQSERSYPINSSVIDKGTASHTTVYVNRNSYDKILSATTYGDPKWEEMGCDGEKRWVVVNGQRFECPLSEDEKELRKKLQQSIIDILDEYDKKKSKAKDNGSFKPKGNIEALKGNETVMNLLGRIFNESSVDGILNKLS